MSRGRPGIDPMHQRHPHESTEHVSALAHTSLHQIAVLIEREAMSLPAREQFYELICLELHARAEACSSHQP